ncbi:hypothetical protein ACQEU6_22655 [Spirillospora sp. CA-108201]
MAAGGFLAAHDVNRVQVKDWGTCPNGTKVSSWDTGAAVPAHGVIVEHLDQPGCWVPIKDPSGSVSTSR